MDNAAAVFIARLVNVAAVAGGMPLILAIARLRIPVDCALAGRGKVGGAYVKK